VDLGRVHEKLADLRRELAMSTFRERAGDAARDLTDVLSIASYYSSETE
jgi:hypothetical protein